MPTPPVFCGRVRKRLKRIGLCDFLEGRRVKRVRKYVKGRHLEVRTLTIEGEADERSVEVTTHVSMRVIICQEETKSKA